MPWPKISWKTSTKNQCTCRKWTLQLLQSKWWGFSLKKPWICPSSLHFWHPPQVSAPGLARSGFVWLFSWAGLRKTLRLFISHPLLSHRFFETCFITSVCMCFFKWFVARRGSSADLLRILCNNATMDFFDLLTFAKWEVKQIWWMSSGSSSKTLWVPTTVLRHQHHGHGSKPLLYPFEVWPSDYWPSSNSSHVGLSGVAARL